ncbi:hypothetical protein [Prosthecobacter sp.]|uniref:hypothetical protein n=1 Tax=Prosthecobacter sp. TaxID=1965333 RepID=UPI003782DE99
MNKSIFLSVLAFIGALLMSSCASGPTYSSSVNSPGLKPAPGKGLVLVYWDSGMAGTATTWDLYANDKLVTHGMRRGGFCSIQAQPGPLKLETKQGWNWASLAGLNLINQIKKDQPSLNIAPNQTYFMEMAFGTWREKITQVSAEQGREDIADCHWVNKPH